MTGHGRTDFGTRREVNAMVAQFMEPIPRTFAELPLTRPWQSLRQHLTWLDGAAETWFACKGGVCWLHFDYCFHSFQICEHGTRVELSVTNAACPDRVIDGVVEHFRLLLAPGAAAMQEWRGVGNQPIES